MLVLRKLRFEVQMLDAPILVWQSELFYGSKTFEAKIGIVRNTIRAYGAPTHLHLRTNGVIPS